jgi:hypothetical protein
MAGRYDTRELQRVIAATFSGGELSKFAERWHVLLDREASAADGARVLLKAIEGRDAVPDLLARLREAKPLVEWPEPTERPATAAVAVFTPPPPLVAAAPAAAPAPPAPPPAPPVAPPPALASAGSLADPFAGDPPPAAAGLSSTRRLALLGVVLAAGIGLGVAVVLLVMRSDEPEAAGDQGVAKTAAAQLRLSLGAVAEACRVDARDATSARDLLASGFRRCERPPPRPEAREPDPLPQRQPPPDRPDPQLGIPPQTKPPSHEPICLDRCHGVHEDCRQSECGEEPTSASKYDAWQKCLAGCMTKYARCRLSCR